MTFQCPICVKILLALDSELSKYDDAARVPMNTALDILNKITANKPRLVLLPEEAREEAMRLLRQKLERKEVRIDPETANVLSRIPKNWAKWWDEDPDDDQALRLAMAARSFIATVWAGEKFGEETVAIARSHPISKVQIRQLVSTIHLYHERLNCSGHNSGSW
jgi:hypothetical protein